MKNTFRFLYSIIPMAAPLYFVPAIEFTNKVNIMSYLMWLLILLLVVVCWDLATYMITLMEIENRSDIIKKLKADGGVVSKIIAKVLLTIFLVYTIAYIMVSSLHTQDFIFTDHIQIIVVFIVFVILVPIFLVISQLLNPKKTTK